MLLNINGMLQPSIRDKMAKMWEHLFENFFRIPLNWQEKDSLEGAGS
jgi:hypothetical protein